MRRTRIGYLLKEGIKSIFTHGFMSFASVTIIIACLLIMGSFSLLAVNVDEIITKLEQQNEILVYVDDSGFEHTAEGDQAYLELAMEVGPKLESLPNIRAVQFISREQALENFAAEYENAGMFSDLGSDVLRHRYVVYLEDIALMDRTVQAIREVRGVGRVNAHEELSGYFVTIRNVVSAVSVILIVVLFVISVFIMANTIKLASFNRKEEIGIMKMVGASNFFIRCPFVVEGLVLGLLGGVLAFLIQWGIYDLICGKVISGLIGYFFTPIPFETLMWPVLIIFVGIGLVVGAFGSNIAIRNYLKV